MIWLLIYLGIGLLVFFFLLYASIGIPTEEENPNMIVVSWICLFLLCTLLWPVILSMISIIFKALHQKKMHKYITGFGLLTIVEVFEQEKEPVLFLASSKKGDLFLGLLIDDTEDFRQHIYVPVSKHRMQMLRDGEIDVLTALQKSESCSIFSVIRDKTTKNEYNEWVNIKEIEESKLPQKGEKLCH
jgi:hypothetical protein